MGLVGGLANRIKAITGKGSWTASPDATLADAKTHHDRTDNPHSVTRGQIGAAAASALSSHTADQSNPHGVTASQAGARPATWVPGWNEVTGKPVSFPSSWSEVAGKPSSYPTTWTEVSGKPSVFAPTNHNDRHRAGGLDPLTASDVGAAPSSHVGSGGSAHANASSTQAGFLSVVDKAKLDGLVSATPNPASLTTTLPQTQPLSVGFQKLLYSQDFVAARPNRYLIRLTAFLSSALSSPARIFLRLAVNGVDRIARATDDDVYPAGSRPTVTGLSFVELAAGDVVTVDVYTDTAVSLQPGEGTEMKVIEI